jgi:hypothetical protein
MLHRCSSLALLIAGFALLAPVVGQPPLPPKPFKPPGSTGRPDALAALQKLTGAKRPDLEQAVRGVAVYPAQTRAAILDLAQYSQKHPDLLKQLAKLRNASPKAIDRYLTSNKLEPALQQAAARVLVEAPETVEKMRERPDLVAIVGLAWATPPGKKLISTVLDLIAASQEKTRDNSADRWASRLQADPKLMQQFIQLLEEFTQKTTPRGQEPDNTWESYGYGIYKSKDGYVVDDVPSADVVNYILAVGTQYLAVSNAVIQQYLDGENQDDFNDAVGAWYNTNGSSIPRSARQSDSDYYDLLEELGNLNNALSQQSGSGNSGSSGAGAAGAFLKANRARYPKLSKWQAKNPAPKPGSPAKLTRLRDGPRRDAGKTSSDPLGKKGSTRTPSASPFSDRLKATPTGARARPTPHAGQNPFTIASRPKGAASRSRGTPNRLSRGSPSVGHQLTRAPRQMGATWRPARKR